MIYYHGRALPCFFERAMRDKCFEGATHRVVGDHVLMHVCAEHIDRARARLICGADAEVVELNADGWDTLDAVPMDPEGLMDTAPHVKKIVTADGHVVERDNDMGAR